MSGAGHCGPHTGLAAWRHQPRGALAGLPAFDNPLTLRVALSFAAIYATVLVLIHLVNDVFGRGVYLVSALAAVPGADAPSLSLARLAGDGRLAPETAAVGVVVVALAATASKLGILAAVGDRRILRRVGPTLLAIGATGAVSLLALR